VQGTMTPVVTQMSLSDLVLVVMTKVTAAAAVMATAASRHARWQRAPSPSRATVSPSPERPVDARTREAFPPGRRTAS
jgi:hypothetical protein